MTADVGAADWARIDAALDELLGLPAERRAEAIARLAGGDEAFARTLRSMASGLEGDDPLLDQSAAQVLLGPTPTVAGLAPGTRLGPWRIVEAIGRGGMGEVYRAERADGQFEQRVAIKLMRADAATLLARFQVERQIVARLDHPGIARLLDGDVSADGRPYMAMELVEGRQLIDWCAAQRSSLDQRLALFDQICDAVAYAHRNLVVHRDLKPANVLVGADGRPKLLDFGIARLLDSPVGQVTQEALLTPGYAAPEQLSGGAITTAADVYALGLLLHELLCGQPAHAVRGLSLAAAMHQVLQGDVVPPSRAARALPDPPVSAARLTGDLDAIVAKALRPEPEQRYASVDALRQDIARHASHQPVLARRGSWAYVAGRALRRHRAVALAAAGVLATVVVGTGLVAWQARVARDEARRATAVQEFLLSLFRANTPEIARGREITAKELLAQGAERMDKALADQPLALAQLHTDLGDILFDMGQLAPALKQLDQALAQYRALGLADRAEGLLALYFHANVLWLQQDLAGAEKEYRRAIAGDAALGPAGPLAVKARGRLAWVLWQRGDYDAAQQVAEQGLAQPVGPDPVDDGARRLGLLQVIGLVQSDRGQYDAALATQRRLIAAVETTPGTTMTARFNYRNAYGRTLFLAGRYAEAVAECEAMLPPMLKIFGPGSDTVIKARQLLVVSLAGLGRYEPALALARENLAARIAGGTNDEESVAMTRAPVGDLLTRVGRYDEAVPVLREAVDTLQRHHVERTTHDLEAIRRQLGRALLGSGDLAEGTRVMALARDRLRVIDPGETSPDWGATFESLAATRRLAGDMAGSEQLLDRGCANLARSPGRSSPAFLRCEAQRTWLVARRSAAGDGAARAAFAAVAQNYAQPLDAAHPARADLAAMQAALDHPGRPFGADHRGPAILLH